MSDRLTTISLFSGAGGLDFGFQAAGFRTLAATDYEHDACETLKLNGCDNVIEGDIHAISSSSLLEAAKCESGQYDVLIGGPPCQPFSKSGYWASGKSKRLDDPRAKTLEAFLRVVDETQPRAFLLENVEGMKYAGKSEGLDFLVNEVEEINKKNGTNYRPHFSVLKATDFGVPQTRARFFMIASREGQKFTFPEPTHAENVDSLNRVVTAWDAIGGMKPEADENLEMKGKWADLLPSIPEGQNYLFHTDRGNGLPLFGWRRRYWSFLLKLAKNRPSWTIQAQPGPAVGPFHWDNRLLSRGELSALQTFPEDVCFYGSRRSIQKQIGNAVPSLMAEIIAREIAVQFFGKTYLEGPKLQVQLATTIPPQETPLEVPEKFFELAGEHEAHPGTGKGYGALRIPDATGQLYLLKT